MNLLLDTHLLLWAASDPQRLPAEVAALLEDGDNKLYFSAASLWEVVIKNSLARADFKVDPHSLRRGLVENGYLELPVTAQHASHSSHCSRLKGPMLWRTSPLIATSTSTNGTATTNHSATATNRS